MEHGSHALEIFWKVLLVLGLVLLVVVHSASIQDGAGGLLTLQKLFDHIKHNLHNRWCRLKLIWADGGTLRSLMPFANDSAGPCKS